MATYAVPVTVQFERGDGTLQEATATVLDRALPNRVVRAAVAFAIFFCCAFLGLFIPLMHFILPVTLLVTGVVLVVRRLRETSSLVALRCMCLGCKAERVIPTSGRFRDARTLRCTQCAEKLTMRISAATRAMR